ncbi:DSC E3 ubiquitin ligase complex subunit 3 [Achaetomium macrosporum]|uniref:DSC E3 ubiquitin ligase complex subunit 3 n=1 Tax=Achaetomium macrosporum TaxID=79813 RepID=A0AAN7CIF5_9PEZI|nr:DSC E3 ubiquitin ligase complex subunit 3 [Achaetomium macrosporum]
MGSSRRNNGGSGSGSSSSASSPTRPPRDRRHLIPRSPSALLFPPAPPPLHITIRFSTALPDLELDIPSPQQTTVVALKHLIRGRLAADAGAAANDHEPSTQPTPAAQASRARLRFIHNGRILPDASVLSAVLKAPPPPPLSLPHNDPKGKSPAGVRPHQQQRVFINCSIGDELSASDLEAEATAAAAPPPPTTTSPPSPLPTSSRSSPGPPPPLVTTNLPPSGETNNNNNDRPPARTERPPLGFDRLQQAGLTAAEISTLRSHFRAIHTARFTPDTMPSPDTLRAMEDAWLDNGQSQVPTTTTHVYGGSNGDVGGDGDGGGGDGMVSEAMDDAFGLSAVAGPLIQGMLIGFVFPLGVIGWLGKEDGVWSRRMQVFVVFGVLLSVSVGLVRGLTGEG